MHEKAGFNPWEILAEAADNMHNGIDATDLGSHSDRTTGKKSRVIQNGVYHSCASVNEEDDETKEWNEFGGDSA